VNFKGNVVQEKPLTFSPLAGDGGMYECHGIVLLKKQQSGSSTGSALKRRVLNNESGEARRTEFETPLFIPTVPKPFFLFVSYHTDIHTDTLLAGQ
jgi:hypothetical protein